MKHAGSPFTFVAIWLVLCVAEPATGQILYVRPVGTGAQQVGQLRQVNADGTGDTAVAVPFADVLGPVPARDGTQFALSAVDPTRPNQISRNVFTVNRTTGAIQNSTNFLDMLDPDTLLYTYVYGFYKAFSPDGTKIAVNSYYRSGGGGASETGTPILQIFPSDGSSGSLALVHADPFLDGTHHGGEGIDWSPVNADQIVAPIKWDAPLISGGGVGEATALFLAEPVTGGGAARQLTFPRADATSNIGTGEVTLWAEHDYQPKFSPNGTGVAYVRSFQLVSNLRIIPDPYVESLRIAAVDGSSDIQVAVFAPGFYITSVDWSPDGTQLIFDIGPQAFSSGTPLSYAVPDTDSVNIVNVDGTGLRQFLPTPSSQPSWAPALPPSAPPNLGNISTRLSVGTGDNVLIGGFIITGAGDKNVVVRAIGPSLGAFGINGVLADPTLELHDQTGATIATNDNWKDAQEAEITAAGFAPGDTKEAAIIRRLTPGAYTAIVSGRNGDTGIGLVEAYGLDGTAQVVNISTRGFVQTGDNAMIGGFIVLDTGTTTTVLVRAIGPSLTGVSNAMADPTLELHDGNGATLASNDNWKDTQQTEIQATGLAPTKDKESAILKTLSAGAYTAVVLGKDNSTGVGLIEAYNLQ
ncbi:MAG TPA: hypothetical protein VGL24_04600 [Chthoniobacterales bacterium]